jgi:hypothetical protein
MVQADMSDKHLGIAGTIVLASWLQWNAAVQESLTHLDVSRNYFFDFSPHNKEQRNDITGVEALAEAIKKVGIFCLLC